jgi:hypothetical protein
MYSDWRWRLKEVSFIYYNENEKVWECIIGDSLASKRRTIIKYLHQLQNLYFALTGEELEIEL